MEKKEYYTVKEILDHMSEFIQVKPQWLGKQKECEVCGLPFDIGAQSVMVDGKTVSGPWALMCQYCGIEQGVRIGVGRGQVYNLVTKFKLAHAPR